MWEELGFKSRQHLGGFSVKEDAVDPSYFNFFQWTWQKSLFYCQC
jgi:hypothetical protein